MHVKVYIGEDDNFSAQFCVVRDIYQRSGNIEFLGNGLKNMMLDNVMKLWTTLLTKLVS